MRRIGTRRGSPKAATARDTSAALLVGRRAPAALGFRVRSGRATAVLLVSAPGPGVPTVADRREVLLSDPALPPTRQPYHAVLEASGPAAARLERRLVSVVRRAARTSVRTLLRAYRAAGHRPRRAALVVGSVIAPATIANDHIRAHALEGRLFRIVLEEALRSEGLACITVVERQAYALAARVLRRPERTLRREVTDLGRPLAGPWRAEEKTATLGAWMALGAPPTRRGRPGRRLPG